MTEDMYRLGHEWQRSRILPPEEETEEDEEDPELTETQVFSSQNSRKRLAPAAWTRIGAPASCSPAIPPVGKQYWPNSKDPAHYTGTARQKRIANSSGVQLEKKVDLPAWTRLRQTQHPAGHNESENIKAALVANQLLQQSIQLMITEIEHGLQSTVKYQDGLIHLTGKYRPPLCETSCDVFQRPALEYRRDDLNGEQKQNDMRGTLNTQHSFNSRLQSFWHQKYFRGAPRPLVGSFSEITCHQTAKGFHLQKEVEQSRWAQLRTSVQLNFRNTKPWTVNDDKNLKQGVQRCFRSARGLVQDKITLAEVAGIGLARLQDLLEPSNGLVSVMNANQTVTWDELARDYLPARHPEDCRLRWVNCRDPRLEQGVFTDEEDKILLELLHETRSDTWDSIASKLSSRNVDDALLAKIRLRTITQCAGRFQAHLNLDLIKSSWSMEEDAQLRHFVQRNGLRRWAEAALQLPGHTHAQALHRWHKVLVPGRRKGTWSNHEDESLRLAVAAYTRVKISTVPGVRDAGDSGMTNTFSKGVTLPWSKIAPHVLSRTDVQCRERWTNVLDPDLQNSAAMIWNTADDDALCTAIKEFTTFYYNNANRSRAPVTAWSRVAERLGQNLTDKMCRNRHKRLLRARKTERECIDLPDA